jgi:hypothetical protein
MPLLFGRTFCKSYGHSLPSPRLCGWQFSLQRYVSHNRNQIRWHFSYARIYLADGKHMATNPLLNARNELIKKLSTQFSYIGNELF